MLSVKINAREINTALEREISLKLKEMAQDIFTKSQDNLIEKGKVNTGELLKSGTISIRPLSAHIVYDAPYADYVEYGTEPHYPPIAPLKKWAHLKLGLSDKESTNVAFAVQQKIGKEGTDPTRYLRDAIFYVSKKY